MSVYLYKREMVKKSGGKWKTYVRYDVYLQHDLRKSFRKKADALRYFEKLKKRDK